MSALVVGAFGSFIGSFLNVVVYRLPRGVSVVTPRSACGSCGHVIRWYDNLPVVSWLLLRGRCRDCDARISVRYPLVELGSAVFFGLVAWRFTAGLPSGISVAAVVELVAFLYLAAISIALALIDVETRRLPNSLVLPAYPVGIALLGLAAAFGQTPERLIPAGIGLVALAGSYLVLALVRPGAMGMGDVKLAGVLGLFLGWLGVPELLVGSVAAFLLGGIAGLVLLAAGRGRGAALAFGPWMLAGAWIAVFAGRPIATAYLSLFGLV